MNEVDMVKVTDTVPDLDKVRVDEAVSLSLRERAVTVAVSVCDTLCELSMEMDSVPV